MKNLLAVWLVLSPFCSLCGQTNDGIVSQVSVLTIHVSDTNIHDTVFHFLTDVLKLPVDYYPVMLGQRRYAAVYAGNLFIEPCGPYSDMHYPTKEFKALFFGLNCSSDRSPAAIGAGLRRLNLAFEQDGPGTFRIQDASIAEGIYFAVSSKVEDQRAEEKEASLRSAMSANNRDELGLEYVKEIWLGFPEPANLQAWREVLGASSGIDGTLWKLSKHQSLRFVKSQVRGVRGIVFKVRALEAAGRYLKQTKCYGRMVDGRIELDKNRTCGLTISLTEK
jgi:hypothetical protein